MASALRVAEPTDGVSQARAGSATLAAIALSVLTAAVLAVLAHEVASADAFSEHAAARGSVLARAAARGVVDKQHREDGQRGCRAQHLPSACGLGP